MAAPKKFSDDEILKALRREDGMIARAARSMNVSRQSLYKRIRSTPSLTEGLEEIRAVLIDYAESALFKAVKKERAWAIRFVLTHLGHSRGYGKSLSEEAKYPIGEIVITSSRKCGDS